LCPCERREAKAKKKWQTTNVFHEKLTFLKNPALAGRPEKQDPKAKGSNHQGLILRNYTHSACVANQETHAKQKTLQVESFFKVPVG
jgi:hypothetical protein